MEPLKILSYIKSFFSAIKHGITAFRKSDNYEYQNRIIELSETNERLQQENDQLRSESRKQASISALQSKIRRHPETYFTLNDQTDNIRYCTACWDNNQKLIQLNCEDGYYSCPICDNHGFYDRALSSQLEEADLESYLSY